MTRANLANHECFAGEVNHWSHPRPRQLMTCSPRLVGLVPPFVKHDRESPAPRAARTHQDLGEAVSESLRP